MVMVDTCWFMWGQGRLCSPHMHLTPHGFWGVAEALCGSQAVAATESLSLSLSSAGSFITKFNPYSSTPKKSTKCSAPGQVVKNHKQNQTLFPARLAHAGPRASKEQNSKEAHMSQRVDEPTTAGQAP